MSPTTLIDLERLGLAFPDPEFEKTFRAYANYVEDLAGAIGGRYAFDGPLSEAICRETMKRAAVVKVQRRPLGPEGDAALGIILRKAWGPLRSIQRELEDPDFDEEANAWLPTQAYYALYHGIRAAALASRQERVPNTHRGALNFISKQVQRGLLPFPWSGWCAGCPDAKTTSFGGISPTRSVHVLSRSAPETTEDRFAMLLRTTRQKELRRERYPSARKELGKRRLTGADKILVARKLEATTLFDVIWRIRKKSNYEDGDVFVLGAAGPVDARAFAQSLALVADASLAALECLCALYAGPASVARAAESYKRRLRRDPEGVIAGRVASWDTRAGARR